RNRMRIPHFSVQSNHLHLIVEAKDRRSLSQGVKALLRRIVAGLNRLWNRTGGMFIDRYYDHVLRTATEVRRAIAYVLFNAQRHRAWPRAILDPFSSAPAFDGWSSPPRIEDTDSAPVPVVPADTWLGAEGWLRAGPLSPTSPY
ncbi:MAG: hypothetical protein GY711_30385, partial [bacterium]|nr:hypothetical protein [bacterium]